jgi:hypothetical protein
MSSQTIRLGDRVHDRDDPEPDDAIVLNRPPMTASEWEVESRNCTLADDNPDYPDEAAVIVVSFVEKFIEDGPSFDPTEQTALSQSTLNEAGVQYYTFPAPRLTVLESPATGINGAATTTETEDSEPTTFLSPTKDAPESETVHTTDQPVDESDEEGDSEADTGPSPELQHLKTTLEANDLTVTVEDAETSPSSGWARPITFTLMEPVRATARCAYNSTLSSRMQPEKRLHTRRSADQSIDSSGSPYGRTVRMKTDY